MPRLPLHLSSGTGRNSPFSKSIRFVRYGCTNRPFYHIVVMNTKLEQRKPPIEQLGTYDPLANKHNELLIALNFERIQYWLGQGVDVSKSVAFLFGLAGFFPVHPKTYLFAWRKRKNSAENPSNETSTAESTG